MQFFYFIFFVTRANHTLRHRVCYYLNGKTTTVLRHEKTMLLVDFIWHVKG